MFCDLHVISTRWSMTVLFTPITGCPSHVPRWHEKCSLFPDPGLKNMPWGSVNYQQFPTVSHILVCLLSRDLSLLSVLASCSCLSHDDFINTSSHLMLWFNWTHFFTQIGLHPSMQSKQNHTSGRGCSKMSLAKTPFSHRITKHSLTYKEVWTATTMRQSASSHGEHL